MPRFVEMVLRGFSRSLGIETPEDLDAAYKSTVGQQPAEASSAGALPLTRISRTDPS
jgi:hypothetical protein